MSVPRAARKRPKPSTAGSWISGATLEQRRLEAELVAEIEAARKQRRELEIRAEEP